ncbi:MAG TPA: fatty acid desaturase [Gammaproteobacteria bacterium]|nr:fatty acid desaturase [Gammaproteobacteria bacterium]
MQASASHSRPTTALNAFLSTGFVFTGMWTLWLLPLLLPRWPLLGWSILPVVLLTTSWWSLIHEAIHGLLFARRPLNDAAGRLLCILFSLPFQPVAFGHLFHHRRNRSLLDRAEIRPPGGSPAFAATYYLRLLGGLYFAELALCLAAWLPRPRLLRLTARRFDRAGLATDGRLLQSTVLNPHMLRAVRLDAGCILLCLASSLRLYGSHAWLLLLLLLGRGLLISLMDNAYHYGTPLDRPRYALNLRLPGPLSAAILNFNLHRVHHLHPAAPWRRLPELFRQADDRYDGGYLGLSLRQLRGPLDL